MNPQYQCPQIKRLSVLDMQSILRVESGDAQPPR